MGELVLQGACLGHKVAASGLFLIVCLGLRGLSGRVKRRRVNSALNLSYQWPGGG
jgi:hypothetical protein